MENPDILIIGSGVVGLSIADVLSERYPDQSIIILEKELSLGEHASGRNSGVIHAGFYYSKDSLKAKLTRDGNVLMHAFCQEHKIELNRCGKVVVARNSFEDRQIETLLERGQQNGVPLELLDQKQLGEVEPNAKTFSRALFSPTTSSVLIIFV